MSDAKKKYYEILKENECYFILSGLIDFIHIYVSELESEKAELLKFIEDIAYNEIGIEYEWPTLNAFELLKKHGVIK